MIPLGWSWDSIVNKWCFSFWVNSVDVFFHRWRILALNLDVRGCEETLDTR